MSVLVDDAVGGSDRTRREMVADRGGTEAVRFDALVQIAERIVADRRVAAERGDVGRLALVIDTDGVAEMAGSDDDRPTEPGELTVGGRRVAPEVAKRWSCDVRASVVLEQGGHACDEGRETRIVNRRLRRALHRRDGGMCRFAGCSATRWLHAHHVVHWADEGRTDLANLVSVCAFHHHLVHEGGWSVAFVDRTVVWSDPESVPATVEPLDGNADRLLEGQRGLGISPSTIESRMIDARLDVHFVVSVLATHIARQRRGRPVDVTAETSPPRPHRGCAKARTPRW